MDYALFQHASQTKSSQDNWNVQAKDHAYYLMFHFHVFVRSVTFYYSVRNVLRLINGILQVKIVIQALVSH